MHAITDGYIKKKVAKITVSNFVNWEMIVNNTEHTSPQLPKYGFDLMGFHIAPHLQELNI